MQTLDACSLDSQYVDQTWSEIKILHTMPQQDTKSFRDQAKGMVKNFYLEKCDASSLCSVTQWVVDKLVINHATNSFF